MALKKIETRATLTLIYGGLSFSAELPAMMVEGHPKPVFRGTDIGLLENAAARWIIEHGTNAPETIRALRAAAGLTGAQLAELLGVDKSHVSKWENGKSDPGVALWNTVADLAIDAMEGSTRTVDRLRATQTEQPIVTGAIRLAVG